MRKRQRKKNLKRCGLWLSKEQQERFIRALADSNNLLSRYRITTLPEVELPPELLRDDGHQNEHTARAMEGDRRGAVPSKSCNRRMCSAEWGSS